MVGKLSDCSLSNNDRSISLLLEEQPERVRTGNCFGSPTNVMVVGLYLKGMSDSGSDAWHASSMITASNSESFLVGSRHTASTNALDPAPLRVATTTLQLPRTCDRSLAFPIIFLLFLRLGC